MVLALLEPHRVLLSVALGPWQPQPRCSASMVSDSVVRAGSSANGAGAHESSGRVAVRLSRPLHSVRTFCESSVSI